MRVTANPGAGANGGPRIFHVVWCTYSSETRQLVLAFRDGRMCIELVGPWELEMAPSNTRPHSIGEAERIHDGRSLVTM